MSASGLDRAWIAREAAHDLPDGAVVNLGIGLPQLVAGSIEPEREVVLHAENGVLGVLGRADPGHEDPDLIDAGKTPIAVRPGAAFVDHVQSFAIIRGGHLDACVLGAYEVSAYGDLANWTTGQTAAPAVGGAMDLAHGARSVRVVMTHRNRDGRSKLVTRCLLPLTAERVVDLVYTEFGVFEPVDGVFVARALAVPLVDVPPGDAEIVLAEDCLDLPRAAGSPPIVPRGHRPSVAPQPN